MPSGHFQYIGGDCAVLQSFGFIQGSYKMSQADQDAIRALLKKDVADHPEMGLLAITADYYQTHAHPWLKDLGFGPVFRFKSSHGGAEVLTVWAKENEKAANTRYTAPIRTLSNCSVGLNPLTNTYEAGKYLSIETTDPKNAAYTKIKGVTVWYKINPNHLVAEPAAPTT